VGSSPASRLAGKAALVTGAGRGVGRAIARKLAAEGARVLVNDLDAEPAQETVAEIAAAGGEAALLAGDVAAPDFGERAVAALLERFGRLDIVVNNAGYIWNTTIQKTLDEQWYAMMDVHATAPFRILRAAFPYLREAAARERAAGRVVHRKVVNVSSVSGLYGAATQIAYSAAKSAQVGITRSLAKEWGRYAVNVNCVAFGYIETRLTQPLVQGEARIEVGERSLKVGLDPVWIDRMRELIPLGRPGTAEEAAGAVYLLCTPESDYVSGQVLVAGGGLLL
jgi:3-oxoacyl-[acyl-carrier protein] reductase